MADSTFERYERIHPEDFSVSTVQDVFDNSDEKTEDLSGRWRECADGKSLVRPVAKGSGDGFPKRIDYAPKARSRNPNAPPTPSNLATYRWRGPVLQAAEEAALICRAQAGDKRAGLGLFRAFHRYILKIAGKHRGHHSCGRETNEFFHELIAAGALAFWECVLSWKPELGYRLATHLRLRVSGAIGDEAKRYRKRGITGETLLQRIAFTRPYYPEFTHAELRTLQKQKRYRSFREALAAFEVAIWDVDRWTQPYSCYSEGGEDDNRSLTGVLLENGGADDVAQKEPKPAKGMDRLYDCFNPYKQSPQLRLYQTHSRYIDGLAEDADKRAARRLKQIGRRARALELVEQHDARIEAAKKRDDAEWAAACASRRGVVIDAAPIARRRKHTGPRRHPTKIRSWRAPPKAAAA
jgi:hypothetical protein